jgi:hypothetical protein
VHVAGGRDDKGREAELRANQWCQRRVEGGLRESARHRASKLAAAGSKHSTACWTRRQLALTLPSISGSGREAWGGGASVPAPAQPARGHTPWLPLRCGARCFQQVAARPPDQPAQSGSKHTHNSSPGL